jgi:hypothetical protein
MMPEQTSPASRLSDEELDDLQLVVQTSLPEDTLQAMRKNFPIEQQPNWQVVTEKIEQGWIQIHELRTKSTGELLSSRLLVDYPSRKRGEVQFLLASFVVTPDGGGREGSRQSKSKGYGSLLREKSVALSRKQKPHALGIVAERESPKGVSKSDDQRVRRASWMSRIGLFRVDGYDYEIPPLVNDAADYVPVSQRHGDLKQADLMIFRFDGKASISGKTLKSIVERLYLIGYALSADDEFYRKRIECIDEGGDYQLIPD